jgi:hypothetical protein
MRLNYFYTLPSMRRGQESSVFVFWPERPQKHLCKDEISGDADLSMPNQRLPFGTTSNAAATLLSSQQSGRRRDVPDWKSGIGVIRRKVCQKFPRAQ